MMVSRVESSPVVSRSRATHTCSKGEIADASIDVKEDILKEDLPALRR
jgi:hypothetical protein